MAERQPQPVVRRCRECGCTDGRACEGGCWWVLPDVCSSCAAALLTNDGIDATPVLLGGAVLAALRDGGPAAVMGILAEIAAVDEAQAAYAGVHGVAFPDEHDGFEPEFTAPRLWRPGDPV